MWSKLKKQIESRFADGLKLRIHCVNYRMDGKTAANTTSYPRYWVQLDKNILFDFPKEFIKKPGFWDITYDQNIVDISRMLGEYLNTGTSDLLTKDFGDRWGLMDFILAADKRIGSRRILPLAKRVSNPKAHLILEKRFPRYKETLIGEKIQGMKVE